MGALRGGAKPRGEPVATVPLGRWADGGLAGSAQVSAAAPPSSGEGPFSLSTAGRGAGTPCPPTPSPGRALAAPRVSGTQIPIPARSAQVPPFDCSRTPALGVSLCLPPSLLLHALQKFGPSPRAQSPALTLRGAEPKRPARESGGWRREHGAPHSGLAARAADSAEKGEEAAALSPAHSPTPLRDAAQRRPRPPARYPRGAGGWSRRGPGERPAGRAPRGPARARLEPLARGSERGRPALLAALGGPFWPTACSLFFLSAVSSPELISRLSIIRVKTVVRHDSGMTLEKI